MCVLIVKCSISRVVSIVIRYIPKKKYLCIKQPRLAPLFLFWSTLQNQNIWLPTFKTFCIRMAFGFPSSGFEPRLYVQSLFFIWPVLLTYFPLLFNLHFKLSKFQLVTKAKENNETGFSSCPTLVTRAGMQSSCSRSYFKFYLEKQVQDWTWRSC